ncbi:MAG: O-antigen ligase family protein [bacterium]
MDRIIRIGIYLLAFTLPIQTRYIFFSGQLNNNAWDFGTISLYGTDILIIILLILTLIKYPINKSYKTYYYLMLGIFLFSLISITTAFDKGLAAFAMIKLIMGMSIFWIIIHNKFDKLKLWVSFLLGAMIHAGIGIWQFLTQSAFANKWLGMAWHSAQELGTSVVETIGADGLWERWLRAYGGLDHPNILGGFLAISLLIILTLSIKLKNKSYIIFFYIITAIITAGLFFSFSRTAWLALIIGIIVIIIQHRKQFKDLIIPLAIIILTAGVLLSQYHYIATSRFGDQHRLEVKSIDERISYIKNAKELIKNHPLTGVGIGNYGLAVNKEIDDRQVSYWYQPVHNVFLLIWAEVGIISLLFYLVLFIYLITQTIKKHCTSLSFSLLSAFFVIMMFDHWLWSLHFGQLLLWIILAMVVCKKN